MSKGLAVLVVPENDRQFRLIEKAVLGVGVQSIDVVSGGDEALYRLSRKTCDVCVLSHELPGNRTGLDTLLTLRTQHPNLPVIMISRSGSEKVAVGAFHAGVIDYLPITRGYEAAVASLISQIKVAAASDTVVPSQIVPAGIPEQAIRPTYQNKLRAIGRHLDVQRFRRINILEVDGGFVVRTTPAGSRTIETLEFIDSQFPQLLASASASRGDGERPKQGFHGLVPTGYEDLLRAVGHQLDGVAAEAVTFSELDELAVVGGVGRVDGTGVTRYGPIQWLFRPENVADLLNQAYQRRSAVRASGSGSGGGIFRRLTG